MPALFLAPPALAPETTTAAIATHAPTTATDVPATLFTLFLLRAYSNCRFEDIDPAPLGGRASSHAQGNPNNPRRPASAARQGQSYSPRGIVQEARVRHCTG